jgi:hypothetical protein
VSAERDGHFAVVTGVQMEECPACGARSLGYDVAETLDGILRRLVASGAETPTAHWAASHVRRLSQAVVRSTSPEALRTRSGSSSLG